MKTMSELKLDITYSQGSVVCTDNLNQQFPESACLSITVLGRELGHKWCFRPRPSQLFAWPDTEPRHSARLFLSPTSISLSPGESRRHAFDFVLVPLKYLYSINKTGPRDWEPLDYAKMSLHSPCYFHIPLEEVSSSAQV